MFFILKSVLSNTNHLYVVVWIQVSLPITNKYMNGNRFRLYLLYYIFLTFSSIFLPQHWLSAKLIYVDPFRYQIKNFAFIIYHHVIITAEVILIINGHPLLLSLVLCKPSKWASRIHTVLKNIGFPARPKSVCPCVAVHKRMMFMSSALLFQPTTVGLNCLYD